MIFQVKCYGAELLRQVSERINLLEVDYFDLEFLDEAKNPVIFAWNIVGFAIMWIVSFLVLVGSREALIEAGTTEWP